MHLLLAAPLAGFLLNGALSLFLKTAPFAAGHPGAVPRPGGGPSRSAKLLAASIGCGACLISFLSAMALLLEGNYRRIFLMPWLEIGGLHIPISFDIDPLSLAMALLITGAGSAIHIYSASYMAKDPGFIRYFAFLNFFVFNMLLLVTASHLPLLFAGWEGVGLCSYLLIGFWRKTPSNVKSSMIAFITNRAGDICFVLGAFFLFSQFKTFDFQALNSLALREGGAAFFSPLSLGALFLLFASAAKSAQLPLHVWLSWAMAGPTPVSALIHAATMVTAGVYLTARLFAVYAASPEVLSVMGWMGAATALIAALSAAAQWDLKKILAYSTVSQLGFMFMALSAKAFSAAIFHLLTHGVFKALLFLSAGSLIYGFSGEKDIRKMGGRKFFPITFPAWMAGALSLMAIPPFSGFFSKDEILWSLFAGGKRGVWLAALLASMITVFYMTRATWMIFFKPRPQGAPPPRESRGLMAWPLIILSWLALIAGFLGVPHILSEVLPFHPPHILSRFLSFLQVREFKGSSFMEWGALTLTLSLTLNVAVLSAYYFSKGYGKAPWRLFEKAFYADDIMERFLIRPFKSAAGAVRLALEERLIQNGARSMARSFVGLSAYLEFLQKGGLSRFALYFALAAAGLIQIALIK